MADSVRERIQAEISSRLTADRGYQRPTAPYRFMTSGEDFLGVFTPYGANQAQFQITVEQGALRPPPTGDPLADWLAAEQLGNAMLASIIADMGVALISDGTGDLCNPPLYSGGNVAVPEPEHDLVQVEALFVVTYEWIRGDPETPALPV